MAERLEYTSLPGTHAFGEANNRHENKPNTRYVCYAKFRRGWNRILTWLPHKRVARIEQDVADILDEINFDI